jgi:hypothetical protein
MSVFINSNSGIMELLDGLRTAMKVDVESVTAHYHLTKIESAFVFMQKKMPSRKQAESESELVLYYIVIRGCLTSTPESALMAHCSCPCERCTIKIIQSGVKEVVYNLEYKVYATTWYITHDADSFDSDKHSAVLFKEAGVILRKHAPPPDI